LFDEGLRVSPRTVLARIDPERYRLEAQRAEAAYRRAEADQRRAEADYQRREELARENLVAAEELNRARGERDRLAAEAASMQAAWNIALQNVRRSEVRAPAGGVINTKKIDKGQWVKQGDVLSTIVDISRLRLRFKVSEGESLRAGRNQPITFKVSSLGNARFEGRIYHVGEVADPATRQVEVLAWVTNPGVLKPGFFAEVELASETHKSAIVVPERAVQASERGFVTFVVEDAKARARKVEIGVRTGDGGVEILGGLKPGEIVVVEGNDRVADGVDVVVAVAGAPPAAGPAAAGASAGTSR
jgi:RND family efflux transporter MFP subunit